MATDRQLETRVPGHTMIQDDLRQWLAIYGPGLEAEVSLLQQLRRLSVLQQDPATIRNPDQLSLIAQERDRIVAALVKIDHELRPAREALSSRSDEAATLDGFDTVQALRQAAQELVAAILSADQDTIRALQDADVARRLASQTVGTAGSTIAAYRRVVAPPLMGAGLVDRRG